MSDEALDDGEDIELEATPRQSGMSGKKIVMMIVLPILLLIGLIAVVLMTGLPSKLMGGSSAEEETEPKKKTEGTVFYQLPTILVNLNAGEGEKSFLKLEVVLEVQSQQGKEKIKQIKPVIVDNFQVYLRQLRMEDLQGSAGLQRMREELLRRVRAAADGAKVKNVLFKEMLVQ